MTSRGRLILAAALALALPGCASRVCGREMSGVAGSRRAANEACRVWVREEYVSWDDAAEQIDLRPWEVHWGASLLSGGPNDVHATVTPHADRFVFRFRDPSKLSAADLREDVVHEVSHVVLLWAGVDPKKHHALMARVLKDPSHSR